MMDYIAGYLVAVNILAFLLYGADKRKAKKSKRRISERTLLSVAAIGGSIGAIAGMRYFHHKTQHKKFYIGLPVILMTQTALVVCVIILGKANLFSTFGF